MSRPLPMACTLCSQCWRASKMCPCWPAALMWRASRSHGKSGEERPAQARAGSDSLVPPTSPGAPACRAQPLAPQASTHLNSSVASCISLISLLLQRKCLLKWILQQQHTAAALEHRSQPLDAPRPCFKACKCSVAQTSPSSAAGRSTPARLLVSRPRVCTPWRRPGRSSR